MAKEMELVEWSGISPGTAALTEAQRGER